jgi:hypothetical protein
MPNLDRFACGLPDPQAEPALYTCDNCGCEIYEGELYYDVHSEKACSTSCALELAGAVEMYA